jgi:DNA-binding transcriptional ArsR family regulator
MADKDVKRLSKAFKALANPNRLRLFLNLWTESRLDVSKGRVHECFLSPLLEGLKIGAPTVSHHVKQLENADLIVTHKEGKQLTVSVNPAMLDELRLLFQEVA